jgi:Wax ester synthase-like Acyl-CoA acyltransferase domain/WS/DGAT C-terminal domain
MPPRPPSSPSHELIPISLDDRVWLKVSDATRNLVSSGVLFFGGALDMELVRERVRTTFPSYPKLVARPDPTPGAWRWQPLPDFDVLDHVELRRCPAELRDEGGRLVADAELEDMLRELVGQSLPRDQPQWRLVVIEGLRYADGPAFCLVFRTHHCVADGVAYYDILANLCQHPDRGQHHVRREPTARAAFWRSLWENTKYLLGTLRPEPPTFLAEGPATGLWLAISAPFPVADLARLAKREGVSLNALALASLARAIAAQASASAGSCPRRVRAVLPVSAHQRDGTTAELVNRMGYFHVHLDLHEPDAIALARGIDAEMRGFKTFRIDTLMQNVARLIAMLPGVLAKPLHRFFCSRASLVVSCFPFPSTPLMLGSARAVNIGAFPVVPHPLGTSTMIVTHGGSLTLYARSILRAEGATGLVTHFGAALQAVGRPAPHSEPAALPAAAPPAA